MTETDNLFHLRLEDVPSPVARHILHPFKIGLGITARSTWIFLKFAALITSIVAAAVSLALAVFGVKWLILWSLWTVIPLSIPPLLFLIWLIGMAAVSVNKAQEANIIHYDDSTIEPR